MIVAAEELAVLNRGVEEGGSCLVEEYVAQGYVGAGLDTVSSGLDEGSEAFEVAGLEQGHAGCMDSLAETALGAAVCLQDGDSNRE